MNLRKLWVSMGKLLFALGTKAVKCETLECALSQFWVVRATAGATLTADATLQSIDNHVSIQYRPPK